MRAFIVRPFGTKEGINFNDVEEKLIDPALRELEIEGRTTGEILEAGNIRVDMFQYLLVGDLVIADISIRNANVFYELGIRHALRDRHTYLLRAKPREGAPAEDVPFDLKTDRYLEYDSTDPSASIPLLIEGLRQTFASRRQDSPVFLSLPDLDAQDPSHFLPVPAGFREEVEYAANTNDPGKLALLGFEVRSLPWEAPGLRVVGRAQYLREYYGTAKMTWEAVLELNPYDPEANHLLGTIYQRLGDLVRSNIVLQRLISEPRENRAILAETQALRARNTKQMWLSSWRSAGPETRRAEALRSSLLIEAYEQYEQAFRQDLNAYYPGLNGLAMLVLILHLAKEMPAIWSDRFDPREEAKRALKDYERRCQQLTGAVQTCIAANIAKQDVPNLWLKVSEADFLLLTAKKAGPVYAAYRGVAEKMDPLMRGSVRRQLQIYEDLGLFPEKVQKALEAVPPAPGVTHGDQPDRLIVFAGHRIDPPGRATRFPPDCEQKAREAIRKAVEEEQALVAGKILGAAGAASGGDILFHEVCAELGISTRLLLALPPDKYLRASVDPAGSDWTRRFHAIHRASPPLVLAQDERLPSWLHSKKNYNIWQRNNLWLLSHAFASGANSLTVIALWNGEPDDGPGGTGHMLEIAEKRGARTLILDTKKLFGLD
jgi:tetratricopeptide (TPR) repeat protein